DRLKQVVSKIQPGNLNKINERMEIFEQRYFPNSHPNAFEKMSISALDGIYFINIKDIVRCEAEDNYTHIHLRGGEKIIASKTIKSYEELLSGVNFYRVHKSHLINLNFMRKFVKGDGGYLIMDDSKKIEVSRRRRPAFMLRINELQDGI
ncbi:MAG: two-component system LytT family response regulator, partial [Saprospiraceae bacterium]